MTTHQVPEIWYRTKITRFAGILLGYQVVFSPPVAKYNGVSIDTNRLTLQITAIALTAALLLVTTRANQSQPKTTV